MSLQLLIVGGGIGGLAAALALGRGGHRVEVLEQASAFAEIGAGIQLGPNVVRRLRALGLGAALDAITARPTELCVRSAGDGSEITHLPLDAAFAQRYGAPYLCVHRADLHTALLEALAAADGGPQAALETGVAVTRLEGIDDGAAGTQVRAIDRDGHGWAADALIGADGLWSRVRTQVVEADAPPRPTGHMAWRALVPQADLPPTLRSDRVQVWLGPRMHAVAYPVRGGDWLNVVVLAEAVAPPGAPPDARDWDQAASLATLQRATGRIGRNLQALLEAMPGWRAWTLHDRDPLTGAAQMARGRVALLGDAAHPMLPYLAQGAGMAIEDAAVLADCLADASAAQVPAALQRYAAQRWARNGRVQARARRNGRIFHAAGPLRLGRDLVLRTGGARVVDVPWLYAG